MISVWPTQYNHDDAGMSRAPRPTSPARPTRSWGCGRRGCRGECARPAADPSPCSPTGVISTLSTIYTIYTIYTLYHNILRRLLCSSCLLGVCRACASFQPRDQVWVCRRCSAARYGLESICRSDIMISFSNESLCLSLSRQCIGRCLH